MVQAVQLCLQCSCCIPITSQALLVPFDVFSGLYNVIRGKSISTSVACPEQHCREDSRHCYYISTEDPTMDNELQRNSGEQIP